MKLRDILNEALTPSEFRSLMAVGRETALSRINQIWSRLKSQAIKSDNPKDRRTRHLESKDRLYFNIDSANVSDNSAFSALPKIIKYLDENGYDIVDYVQGLVKKKGDDRIIKLGKVLTMLAKTHPRAKLLLTIYNAEKSNLAIGSEYIMVISKHPYDIGGVSTDRSWSSCMDLRGEHKNKEYIPIDVKNGTIVSYLLEKDDLNIKNPIARISIKPYLNKNNQKDVLYGIEQDSVKYGRQHEGYVKTLIKVLDVAQQEKSGIFEFDEDLYWDSDHNSEKRKKIVKFTKEQLKAAESYLKGRVKKFSSDYDELTYEVILEQIPWLLQADFEDAVIGIDQGKLVWLNGVWKNGTWKRGNWLNGVWQNGTWEYGTWKGGVWQNGTWETGVWEDGIWEGGTWQGGDWKGGKWLDKNNPKPSS